MARSFLHVAIAVCVALGAPHAAAAQEGGPTLSDIVEAWLGSPHGDRGAEAFTHWNEDGEIPGTCAVCHSSTGIIAYLKTPMSEPGLIDHPVAPGTTVDCTACHNRAASELSSVRFPSGFVDDTPGASSVCAVCHQGRAFTDTVTKATAGLDDDAISTELGFVNVHYYASAATLMGGAARGGFEYPGKTYKGRFAHVPDLSTCTQCHNPHALNVGLEKCTTCHKGAETFADIRTTPTDFDGDGDTAKGIARPIAALHARLDEALRRYAAEIAGVPVAYSNGSYPYFFIDGDQDGTASETEAVFPNRYQSWTPRLLKAAYNYQLVAKEPAIYVHNPHYALQLLCDSLESLSERVEVDMAGIVRP